MGHGFSSLLRRPLCLVPLAILTASAAASPVVAERGRGTSPRVVQQAGGRLVLRNLAWDSVRVEVRVGNSANCEMNAMAGERILRRGRVWAISAAQPICWRRERSPGHGAVEAWTPWARRAIPPGGMERASP